MQPSPHEDYLVTEVMTAPPQKLQLLMIEAVIRSVERARERWQSQDDEPACEALVRAQEIVGEMISSLNAEAAPDLVRRVASVYVFVFRSLVEASCQRSEEKLDDVLRVLQVERETWRQVCRQLGSGEPSGDQAAPASSLEQPAESPPAVSPTLGANGPTSDSGLATDSAAPGFSVEA